MLIHEARQIISRYLLDDSSIVDAPTAYYALYHDARRSELRVKLRPSGRADGFAGRFQTGYDLFRPLVTMRCRTPDTAADLLAELLIPGRPYLFFAGNHQLPYLGGSFALQTQRLMRIYYLESKRFRPGINVMVVEKPTPGGLPRFEIQSGGLTAVAGINWQSPGFAEVYVHTDPGARKRGWGQAVVTACTEYILRRGRLPLYLVEADNEESLALAEAVGYVDSGAQQVYAEGVYLGHPARRPISIKEEGTAGS